MLTVATWNLENFFRPGAASGPTSQAAYQAKLDNLHDVIAAIAPDVVAVQEVGQPQALDDLVGRLGAPWQGLTSEFPDPRGIRVGFVSQLALTDATQVHDFPADLKAVQVSDDGPDATAMGRGALRVRVDHDGQPVDLVACHLKSKLLEFPPGPGGGPRFNPRDEDERARYAAYALNRRAAEAATVRVYADQLLDGHGDQRRVIVLGDLNDEPDAATTQLLLGPPGSQFGDAGFNRPDQGDAWRLWNLAPLIQPPEQRYSRTYQGHHELIDHILLSHALAAADTQASVHHLDSGPLGPNPLARRDAPVSDHSPVIARLALA